jgi:deoxyribodipyrimidine photo-lyase
MYQNLLDGSRAANLLGWQWTVGSAGKPYGFARWQVEKRAPGLCFKCPLKKNCPIEQFPDEVQLPSVERLDLLSHDAQLERTTGPTQVLKLAEPEEVLITLDSMGDADAALQAHASLPVVFVFNRDALAKLQLSSKRIHFYLETLKDLATRRKLSVYLGSPYEYAKKNAVAVTYAPVPSFAKFEQVAELHPYLWLKKPHAGNIQSFSAWRNKIK